MKSAIVLVFVTATAGCGAVTEAPTPPQLTGSVQELKPSSFLMSTAPLEDAEIVPGQAQLYLRISGGLSQARFSDLRLHDSVRVWHNGSRVDTETPIYEGVVRVEIIR